MCVFFFVYIFKFSVVFFNALCDGDHTEEEYDRCTHHAVFHRNTDFFGEEGVKDDAEDHYYVIIQNTAVLNDRVSLFKVVGNGNRQRVHGYLYKRIGEVIEQIKNEKPCKLDALRNVYRHHIEHSGKQGEHPEYESVPRKVTSVTCNFLQYAVKIVEFKSVDKETENYIVKRVYDFNHQHNACHLGQIYALHEQEHGHERCDKCTFGGSGEVA